jgi:hypothetical protein
MITWQLSERFELPADIRLENGESGVTLYGRGGTVDEASANLERRRAALVDALERRASV